MADSELSGRPGRAPVRAGLLSAVDQAAVELLAGGAAVTPAQGWAKLALVCGTAVVFVALATLLRAWLGIAIPGVEPFGTYFPAVLVATLVGGWRAGLISVALSAVTAWLLFIPPLGVFAIPSPSALASLALFLLSTGAIVWVAHHMRSLVRRLRESRDELETRGLHYSTLFDTMSEGFALCEAIRDENGALVDYVILEINPALQGMLGVGPEVVGTRLSDSRGDRRRWLRQCDKVLRSGEPAGFDFHNVGTGRWHEIHLTRVTENRLAQFFFDITERKAAEARQAQLFDELNHRVKNNLAIVSSLLQMQARGATDPAVRFQLMKAVDRVQSVSELHGSLYKGGRREDVDFGAYLHELCGRLSDSLLDGERVRLEVETEAAEVSVDTAIALGMVVNELVTNAAKYAYPPPESGVISVRFARDADGLVLSIADQGPGLPDDPKGRAGGLGTRLVAALVQQIRGALTVSDGPGATYLVRIPSGPPS